MDKKRKKPRVWFGVMLFISGVFILLYPFVSNIIANRNATEVVRNYEEGINSMAREEIDVVKETARQYNEQLRAVVSLEEEEASENKVITYSEVADTTMSLGYIVIPKIDVYLPIYSGIDENVLKCGVGHVEESSYPLGGESTHCVLNGHRGLPSALLFTELDELELGDEFYLHVLDEILAYKVDEIKVVTPDEAGELYIEEGKDYCTLITCTPYAINTHRLIVRGIRTEFKEDDRKNDKEDNKQENRDICGKVLMIFLVFGIVLFVLLKRRIIKRL